MRKLAYQTLIGMGSNVGDRVVICCAAVERLRDHPAMEDVRRSPFYETDPVGVTDQPGFINLAVAMWTTLSPEDLLAALKSMEKELGRVPRYRWGPREIDLDILLYDQVVLSSERLTIPHPEMHKRAFVLVPACDVAGNWRHPVLNQTLSTLMESIPREGVSPYQGVVPCD